MVDFIFVFALVYLATTAYLYFNQRNLVYFPDKTRPAITAGAEVITVQTSDGLTLEGWYYPPKNPSLPVILHFQGNAGNQAHRAWKAEFFAGQGYGVLLAGYRGYGGNPGSISEEGLYNDGRAYIEFLKTGNRPIILYGESLGTGIATRMAAEYDIAGLILEAPYSSIVDVAQSIYIFVPVRQLLKDKFQSIQSIGKVKAPKLFIHGERDATIPIRFGRKLFDAAQEPKSFISIDSAGHNDLYMNGTALHVLQFLSTIPSKPKD